MHARDTSGRNGRRKWFFLGIAGVLVIALGLAAWTQAMRAPAPQREALPEAEALSGAIAIDGSSTVYPLTEAMAEEFGKKHPGVRVTVGISGTGGGFKRFVRGETDINNASRPIRASEAEQAAANGIEFIEFKVAFDGLSVMVNPRNTWVDHLTVEELKKIWEPGSTIARWNQIRAHWPDRPIRLYGPGTASGTFDYFTEAIMGEEDASRPDYVASEDDNVLVMGIAGDKDALGYFGFAFYVVNADRLRLLAIDDGKGPVLPSQRTINDGTYTPLSRPLFIYVSKRALERPEVREFVRFYLAEAPTLVPQVGYVPLLQAIYDEQLRKVR